MGSLRTTRTRVDVLDVHQFGRPRSGAAFLLRAERTVLVECGTAAAAPGLVAALHGVHLDAIFVSHVHLDHAGGAGHLARAHPEARIVAHERGVPHLADPSRLVAGVRSASPELSPLYGEPLPIPASQLRAAHDGERFALGRDSEIVVVETPGHAPHHVAFFETSRRLLFAGDAAGHFGVPVRVPLTVPPRFDVVASRASLARLRGLAPRAIAYTHFGIARRAIDRLAAYERAVDRWFDKIDDVRRRFGRDDTADRILRSGRLRRLRGPDREVAAMCVRGALASLEAASARGAHDDKPTSPAR